MTTLYIAGLEITGRPDDGSDMAIAEREAAEQLSAAIDRGDAPHLARLVDEMVAQRRGGE